MAVYIYSNNLALFTPLYVCNKCVPRVRHYNLHVNAFDSDTVTATYPVTLPSCFLDKTFIF